MMKRAAIGLRAHSGWAAVVVVAEPLNAPTVVERRRIELADQQIEGSMQPYHAAEDLAIEDAEKYIGRSIETARVLAVESLRDVVKRARKKEYEIVGCGLLLSSARPLPNLPAILASHAIIHTADGELFRDALADASKELGLAVNAVIEREIYERAQSAIGTSDSKLKQRLEEMGTQTGPPWREDQKLAALVAWLTLGATPVKNNTNM